MSPHRLRETSGCAVTVAAKWRGAPYSTERRCAPDPLRPRGVTPGSSTGARCQRDDQALCGHQRRETLISIAAVHPIARQASRVDPSNVLALVAVAQFMVIPDASIVNVALPTIKRDVGFSDQGLSWILNAYTLIFGGFLLLGRRLADRLGRRRLFMAGIALRGLQGLGGVAGGALDHPDDVRGRERAQSSSAAFDASDPDSLAPETDTLVQPRSRVNR